MTTRAGIEKGVIVDLFPAYDDDGGLLVALTEDATNARTEGFNRIIKQTKRAGCGYRNMINYQRRILSHIAVTRPQRSAA